MDEDRPTISAELESARQLLEVMVGSEWPVSRVAYQIVEKLAEVLAQWERFPSVEYGHGRRMLIGINPQRLAAELEQRWQGRGRLDQQNGRSVFKSETMTPLRDQLVLGLLRDGLLVMGLPNDEISSRLNRLPKSSAEKLKRLVACGYCDFFMQFCVVRSDAEVTHAVLYAAYLAWHRAASAARLLLIPALTEKAFSMEIAETVGVTRHKFAKKGEPRESGWRGIGLRDDGAGLQEPRLVARERFTEFEDLIRSGDFERRLAQAFPRTDN